MSATTVAATTGSPPVVEAPAAGRTGPVGDLPFLVQVGATTPGRWQRVTANSVHHAGVTTAVRMCKPFLKPDTEMRVDVHVAPDEPDNIWPNGNPHMIHTLSLALSAPAVSAQGSST